MDILTNSLPPAQLIGADIEQLIPNTEAIGRLLDLLVTANSRMNLTAIRDVAAMRTQHVWDSLALPSLLPEVFARSTDLLDIGTGGGFPLLPLCLARPDLQGIGVDSVAKKLRFVEDAASELGLKVRTSAERAETLGQSKDYREKTDLVTARAVGPVVSLCEVGLPLVRLGGFLVLYKTAASLPELGDAVPTIQVLGGAPPKIYPYRLPSDSQDRILIAIEKSALTPKNFPRTVGIPFHKPLSASKHSNR